MKNDKKKELFNVSVSFNKDVPVDVIKRAIDRYKVKVENGQAFVFYDRPMFIKNIAGVVTDIKQNENNNLFDREVTVEVFKDTPEGSILYDSLVNRDKNYQPIFSSEGQMFLTNGMITDIIMEGISVSYIPNDNKKTCDDSCGDHICPEVYDKLDLNLISCHFTRCDECHGHQELKQLRHLKEKVESGGCTLAGLGRGDCESFMRLPGLSIKGQHDGKDDTVDAYGKPNGWCWSCWKSYKMKKAFEEIAKLEVLNRYIASDKIDLYVHENGGEEEIVASDLRLEIIERAKEIISEETDCDYDFDVDGHEALMLVSVLGEGIIDNIINHVVCNIRKEMMTE